MLKSIHPRRMRQSVFLSENWGMIFGKMSIFKLDKLKKMFVSIVFYFFLCCARHSAKTFKRKLEAILDKIRN